MPAAVEVPQGGREADAGGIDAQLIQRFESGTDGEQFAANGTRPRIGLASLHQSADEIGFQQHVGIQGEYPLAGGGSNHGILGFGKTQVAAMEDGANAAAEMAQHLSGIVGRAIIGYDHLQVGALLGEDFLQAAANVPAAIEGDDRNADGWFGHDSSDQSTKTCGRPVPLH